jgi:hypothetical protein
VKSPTSVLRFISLLLRRTLSTRPSAHALADDTKFARLEFEKFYFAITILNFYEIVNNLWLCKKSFANAINYFGEFDLSLT